jgi:dihydropteroate synthase
MRKLRVEDTNFPSNNHLRVKDNLFDLSKPKVMGIINCTPDSFYKKSQVQTQSEILKKVEQYLVEGVDILDIGGYSSRPGSAHISSEEEINRVLPVIKMIKNEFSTSILSLDTFRSEVARVGIENGVDIINDISAWELDPNLLDVISHYKCPYILMHMKGNPQTMQMNTDYTNLFAEMMSFFSKKIQILHQNDVYDIVLDPGFGFGKTMDQNYEILQNLQHYKILEKPILVGVSRKSMIYKKLNTDPEKSLNGTTALNTIALQKGASILRVHDVKEAKEIIDLLF